MLISRKNCLALLALSSISYLLVISGNNLFVKPAQSQQAPFSPNQAAKSPAGTLEDLAAGESQDLIVLYNDTTIQKQASNLRKQAALTHEDQKIISFKASQYANKKQQILAAIGTKELQVVKDYSNLPMSVIRFKSSAALKRFLASSEVVRVYKNEKRQVSLSQSLAQINQPSVATAGKIGGGTTVAVIDTGVDYTRPAFGSCASPGQTGCKVVFARDFAVSDGVLDDGSGHGTNVAGIVAGVAPGTQIAALDVFQGENASDADILAAVDWSIQNKVTYNIVAINLSLGKNAYSSLCSASAYATPFASAREAGIVPVVASGNNGYSNAIAEPACAPGAVSVGAVYDNNFGAKSWTNPVTKTLLCTDNTTALDRVTCFANSASFLTMLAPGSEILAAGITQSGTSQAAPHVAGAAAVLRSQYPLDTVAQTVSRMTNSGVPVTDPRNGITKPRLNLLTSSTISIPPANDRFIDSNAIGGAAIVINTTNTNATKEVSEPNHAGNSGGRSVWWSWTATKSGSVTITTLGSNFDTILGVYTGSLVGGLTQIAANDGSAGTTSSVTFNAVVGTTYRIAIDGFNAGAGNIKLNINSNAPRADFNNDGKTDILWRRDDGYLSVWFMDSANTLATTLLSPNRADTTWKIAGTGDFNNDNKTDILWRRDDGYIAVWLMNGTSLISSNYINPNRVAETTWKIAGTGDFNNDGKTDILWRRDDGYLSVWFMNGLNLINNVDVIPRQVIETTWKPITTGDFNNDGKTDILWRRDDGYLSVWFMNGVNLVSTTLLNPNRVTETTWKIVGAADFNRDGKTDLLWQRDDGYLSLWYMDGINLTSNVDLNPNQVAETTWKIVGPR